jgi:hypothetical protein
MYIHKKAEYEVSRRKDLLARVKLLATENKRKSVIKCQSNVKLQTILTIVESLIEIRNLGYSNQI